MHRCIARASMLAVVLSLLPWLSTGVGAQIAVSANDNKVVNIDGVNNIVQNPPPDNATIIDLGVSPPKVLGQVNVPNSVVGPPQSVAIAPDESIALVVASTKIDPADPKKTATDNKLSVIDLKASPPAVIATIEVGAGPAGVSFSPDGKLVLVTNRGDGTVSILTVSGKTLTLAGKVDFGNPKSGPSHVAFLPDGKRALVTRDGDHRISVLSVDGTKIEETKAYMVAGVRPYSISISAKGDVAVLTNQGGGQGDTDVISVIDLKKNPPRIVDSISVGQIPEGATMSLDGAYVAVTVQNGSNRPKRHHAYNDHGLVMVYRINGHQARRWRRRPRSAAGPRASSGARMARRCFRRACSSRTLDVLSFDGKELKVTGSIKVEGGPAGIRTVER